jgi:DNA polymerase-3 subunit delta'
MKYPIFFEPKKTLSLFCLQDKLNFLISLYKKKNLPKVLLLTGDKGSGKSTLVNHFLHLIYDEVNYKKNNKISEISPFFKQFMQDIFSNIIYLRGSDYKIIKIEDIRILKNKLRQSTALDRDRFIILDDVELFNKNSLNALLKIIEEPGKNFFILINNKSKPILETIKSRSIEIKIILSHQDKLMITNNLIELFNLKPALNYKSTNLSPGNFIKFDYILNNNNINISDDYITNLSVLLNLYKKNKDILFINIAFFLTDYYFKNEYEKDFSNSNNIYEIKKFIFNNLNDYLMLNLNQFSLLNSISNKLRYG